MLPRRGPPAPSRGAAGGPGALAALVGIAALVALGIAAVALAASTIDRPFPGLLVDPYADFSVVSLPSWGLEKDELKYPARLIAIDGQPLSRSARYPALTAAEAYRALDAQGRTSVVLTIRDPNGGPDRDHPRPLLKMGAEEIGFFFGVYGLAAVLFLWTGGMVLVLAGKREGGRAYALWSVGAYLLFVSFYDYHTTCRLTFAFSLGGVGFILGFLWLAYAFPARPRRLERTLRAAIWTATALGIATAAWLLAAPLLGVDAQRTRMAVGAGVPSSMVVLAASILLRLARAGGAERSELLSATFGLLATPVALAVGYGLLIATGSPLIHLLVPVVVPLVPLSIGVALVRHNILDTSAVLSRRLLVGPVVIASAGLTMLAWLSLRQVIRGELGPWWPPALSAPVLPAALFGLSRLSTRVLFRAAAQFRPSIEQLSDQLSSVHDLPAIRQAIEGVVSRWLPVSAPVLVLEARELGALEPELPAGAAQRVAQGENVWLSEGSRHSALLIPMRSMGFLRGAIRLPPKRGDALYTTEDFTLLATIASLGAVALHHANTLIELERMRRGVVEATRDEKKYALGMLGAELSHEIAYPLNFFRYLLKRCARGDALELQDLEIGSEEVGRLERMLAAMKLLESATPKLAPVAVRDPLRRAVELIREQVEEKSLTVRLEVPEELAVQANGDMAVQIFANLLRNSAQAVDRGGTLGVRAKLTEDDVQLECWDDGPGVPESLRERIWTPWVTTRSGGSGLGLAITQRLVHRLGWRIALETRGPRTAFCIYVPRAAMHGPPERTAA